MMEYQILPKHEIRKWLASLVAKGTTGRLREGPTLQAIGNYLGISRNNMIWFGRKDNANMSMHLQMRFSKLIAQVENGQLEFVIQKEGKVRKKVAVLRDKPRPRVRYQPVFTPAGPRLKTVDRPPPYRPMVTFKGLLGK